MVVTVGSGGTAGDIDWAIYVSTAKGYELSLVRGGYKLGSEDGIRHRRDRPGSTGRMTRTAARAAASSTRGGTGTGGGSRSCVPGTTRSTRNSATSPAGHRPDGVWTEAGEVEGQDDRDPVGPLLDHDHLEPLGKVDADLLRHRLARPLDEAGAKRGILERPLHDPALEDGTLLCGHRRTITLNSPAERRARDSQSISHGSTPTQRAGRGARPLRATQAGLAQEAVSHPRPLPLAPRRVARALRRCHPFDRGRARVDAEPVADARKRHLRVVEDILGAHLQPAALGSRRMSSSMRRCWWYQTPRQKWWKSVGSTFQ